MDMLPNYENAVIPIEKLTGYSLNYNHPKNRGKALAFELALGFNLANYRELITQVQEKLPLFKSVARGTNKFGHLYQVILTIDGVNNKQAEVLTAWIIEYGQKIPSLTSIYVTDKKGIKL
ncbi:MAG: hypothetical protein LBN97_04000 [Oscillospiraceae bacterium]|jgi:hypothetical protein|nr:hypothetical protein [Oscillospiraceae bacterium]